MAWIELHQNMPGHRRTRRVKSILQIDTPAAVGHMCLLWLWALDNAEDGSIGGMLNQEIADVCEYKGDADVFVEALIEAGYLMRTDDDLIIHDWADYCGRLMDKREKNRIRQQNYRERHRGETQEAAGAPQGRHRTPAHPSPTLQAMAAAGGQGAAESETPIGKVVSFYMNRIQAQPSPQSMEELAALTENMDPDVAIWAMQYAIDEHKATWSYIRRTLEAYNARGIHTMADLQRANEQHDNAARRRREEDTHADNSRNSKGGRPTAPRPDAEPLKGFHTEQ